MEVLAEIDMNLSSLARCSVQVRASFGLLCNIIPGSEAMPSDRFPLRHCTGSIARVGSANSAKLSRKLQCPVFDMVS